MTKRTQQQRTRLLGRLNDYILALEALAEFCLQQARALRRIAHTLTAHVGEAEGEGEALLPEEWRR